MKDDADMEVGGAASTTVGWINIGQLVAIPYSLFRLFFVRGMPNTNR